MQQIICAEIPGKSFVFLELLPGFRPNSFSDSMFTITVIYGGNSYSKKAGRTEIAPLFQKFGNNMEIGEYLKKTLAAFNNKSCAISLVDGHVHLNWSMVVAEDIVYTLGSLQLVQDTDSKVLNMLSMVILSHGKLQDRIKSLRESEKVSREERDQAMKSFKELVQKKELSEAEMMKKFKDLLNAKKAKIRQLMEKIQEQT
jgi:hypothetical protein